MAEPWVSVEDVAAHLGVRKDSIYRWIEHRGLPAQKIGKLWKLKLSEVDAWVKAKGARGADGDPELRGRAGLPGSHIAATEPTPRPVPDQFILVVDDHESVRATLNDFLSDVGYRALLAADGAEALDLLHSSGQPRPSLIILDLGMPNMDGWQFLEEQQRDPILSALPVVIVTAERSAEPRGAAAVLRKPLNLGHLADAISRLLGSGGQ